MHYRNGREAKNGDRIVKLKGGEVVSCGVLHSATSENDHCNCNIAVINSHNTNGKTMICDYELRKCELELA